MFGLGGMEVLVILLVGVVVLGPERLPKVMRGFTRVMSEFRRISTDLQRTINSEINLQEYNEQQRKNRAKIGAKGEGGKSPAKKKSASGSKTGSKTKPGTAAQKKAASGDAARPVQKKSAANDSAKPAKAGSDPSGKKNKAARGTPQKNKHQVNNRQAGSQASEIKPEDAATLNPASENIESKSGSQE